jgi:lysozyme
MDPKDIERAMAIVMQLLWRWEGMVLRPYLCSAGVATIGLGSTRYLDGTAVQLTDPPITREQAVVLARDQVRSAYMRGVRGLCPQADTAGRLAALTSLTYNIGVGALRASTLRRKVNADDWDAVPTQFLRWTRAGGRELRGLVARRRAEISHL